MAWKREEASAVVVVWDITGTGDCGGTGEVVWRVGDGRDDSCKPWAVLRKVQYSTSWPGLVSERQAMMIDVQIVQCSHASGYHQVSIATSSLDY